MVRSGKSVYIVCASSTGKVIGSLPDGFALPYSRLAVAVPPSWPGYHMLRMASAWLAHGIATAAPALSTMTTW